MKHNHLLQLMLIAFNKPYGVLSQFSPNSSTHHTLSGFGFPKNVYPLGRLDADSEGLLLLSDEAELNAELLDPSHAHSRTYLVQVDHIPTPATLDKLSHGVIIGSEKTRPCRVHLPDPQPHIPARIPPIRIRKTIPDCWIELTLTEGKNRQVRRMTAAVGHPTLRLLRVSIGKFELADLESGQWLKLTAEQRRLVFATI